ncbi:response regulator [Catenovulum maritimum]|uniref:Response regulatory domain-containing protein n=1 Tax=Catenovulum maritimum TaxID=1513271 RepID=A0A0J8JLT4_9ALTE|nr:response regulator [Catenovulum maritimum]KMT65511.1 hypothetical protein XM47_09185 [Catenovulum maritimum]
MLSGLDYRDKTFLVIDDQRPFQLMLKGILINLGARLVSLAATGEAAIQAAKERQFDFLLIDYNLGARRKNGRQLIEELRERELLKSDCITIMVTGENHRPMVLGAVEMQPDDYLMKPFSQNLLKLRLEKAYKKRWELRNVFAAMMAKDHAKAITECKRLIELNSRYKNYCNNLLAELLCNAGMYDKAEYILKKLLAQKPYTWGQIQLARTYYHQERYHEAAKLANGVMLQSPLLIDAYDLASKSLLKLGHLNRSLEIAIKATELSPYSISRQYQLCEVARKAEMHEIVKDACHNVLEMTRKSVHQSSVHLYNYIRAAITAAEHAEGNHERNKLKQEISLAIQRSKNDEVQENKQEFTVFESFCQARLDIMDKQLLSAKKQLYKVQKQCLESDEGKVPEELVLDAINVMYNIGEFDLADELLASSNINSHQNTFITANLAYLKKESEETQKNFYHYNQEGIEAYKDKNYQEAVYKFDLALTQAPMHTGGTLNLILAILKLIENTDKRPEDLTKRLKLAFSTLDDVDLPESQQTRYQELQKQYQVFFPAKK